MYIYGYYDIWKVPGDVVPEHLVEVPSTYYYFGINFTLLNYTP